MLDIRSRLEFLARCNELLVADSGYRKHVATLIFFLRSWKKNSPVPYFAIYITASAVSV